MSDQPAGPDRNTLRQLAGMLPSFMKGLAHKKSVGRGKPVPTPKATKLCPICADGYEKKNLPPQDRTSPDIVNCPKCQEQLDAGYSAFVCGDWYVFAISPRLSDMAGKIVHVSPHVMEALKKEFDAQPRKNSAGNPGNN